MGHLNDDERVISRLTTWCPECLSPLKFKISYPFSSNTMTIDIDLHLRVKYVFCDFYSKDDYTGTVWECDWGGIYLEMKEK